MSKTHITPEDHAVDALANIGFMLDALNDVNQVGVGEALTLEPQTNGTGLPDRSLRTQHPAMNENETEVEHRDPRYPQQIDAKKRTQLKEANRGKRIDRSRNQKKTGQKKPRKGGDWLPRCSPKPSIRKKKGRNQEEVPHVQQIHKTSSKIGGRGGSGHSSEDKVDQQFLQELKRIAEQRKQVENRRRNAWNAKIGTKMKIIMGTTEKCMRELAGSVASEISKTVRSLTSMTPNDLDSQMKRLEATVAEEKESLSVLKGSMCIFSDTLQKQLNDLLTYFKVNEVECDGNIKRVTAAAKETNLKRRNFRNTLVEIQQVLERDRSMLKYSHSSDSVRAADSV